MLDWNDLKYFLAVHRAGNLARAAAAIGINATTVGRRVTALEQQVGARLFDRTPEGWAATPAALRLLPKAERMEAEVFAITRDVSGADARPSGVVRLTATEVLATRFIAPHLRRFHERHPEITVELVCTSRVLDLAKREADIALRLSRPREEHLVVKRLTNIDVSLYGSRRYLDLHGRPADPERSLAGHRVILFAESRNFAQENEWVEQRLDGAKVVLRSDSVNSVFSSAVGGLGIALLPRVIADAEPSLERIETATSPEPRSVWQSVHEDMQHNARIRATLDFLGRVLVPRTPAGGG